MGIKAPPSIQTISEKKLIGIKLQMSLVQDRTPELWSGFMPARNKIINVVSADLYSLRAYEDTKYFINFSPANKFEKWAAMEVVNFNDIPGNMESFILPAGLYAIFHYKGSSQDASIYNYIYSDWLPDSNYILDNRPHFEVMGNKYKNNDPNSEEHIFIPIKPKE